MKAITAVRTAVNGVLNWWPCAIHTTNGIRYYSRIRANGGKSRPVKLGTLDWVQFPARGDKLTRKQFLFVVQCEWEIQQARKARKIS